PEYAASKGGVIAYMKNVALSLAKYGATVNSLSPGGVITDINEHIINSPDLYQKVLNETLLNKWADVEEIAEFSYFLTVINKSMTGQDILVDNGEAHKSNFIW
ncbi:MAG: SDR family oxidoreductase, partial [Clostridia bacterium]|nr:SDR family oxidoreductase [Clostridia bacterium]